MPEIARSTSEAVPDLAGIWTLDPLRTTIHFQTKALWILPVNGSLRVAEGGGTVDGDGRVSGRVVIDARSIDTKNSRRDKHLRDADFFATQHHPSIVFEVTAARPDAPGKISIEGELSIRGVSHRVAFAALLRNESDGAVCLVGDLGSHAG